MTRYFGIMAPTTNQEVLDKNSDDFNLAGSPLGILWDGDLEDLFVDQEIEVTASADIRDIQWDDTDGSIINFEDGEQLGALELMQDGRVKYFRTVCATYASREKDIYIDFNKGYRTREEACTANWDTLDNDPFGSMIIYKINSMLDDRLKDLSPEDARRMKSSVFTGVKDQVKILERLPYDQIDDSIENFLIKTADEVL